MRSELSVI
ncbi:hypothetical protein BDFB_002371 [Asbolus verrucosus]|uniref:Uncharacterized protein n=1 Tax=Asbolus verrucosus TaxID=1661398 RepID=A0A482WCG1_ASBVE|nr:hypothetical protein BDFB_002371 [Asbolus verrucosus]